jgi:hypothetical protein
LSGNRTYPGAFCPADYFSAGDLAIGLAHAHSVDYVAIIVHLEPPVAHQRILPARICGRIQGFYQVRDAF